jgi:hypothetical protein
MTVPIQRSSPRQAVRMLRCPVSGAVADALNGTIHYPGAPALFILGAGRRLVGRHCIPR